MTTKKHKGLGRGLEALLGPVTGFGSTQNNSADVKEATQVITELKLDQLVAGKYQPRMNMDEGALYELAQSIKTQGVMQPILVRPLAKGAAAEYEIIAGERRFRAAKLAGLSTIPVHVKEATDEAAAAMALIENMQREDLNPLEEAQGLQRLISEFGLTHEAAADAVGRSRSTASNLLRLLNLAKPVQIMLAAGDLDMGHARALLALDKGNQLILANQISAKKLSVRETESMVKKTNLDQGATTKSPKNNSKENNQSTDILRVEQDLSDRLLTTVQIKIKKQLKRNGQTNPQGELVIGFSSLDELNGLIDKLSGE